MPNVLHADETIETQLANALRRIRQLEKRPISSSRELISVQVQAVGGNGSAGFTDFPGFAVGEGVTWTLPIIGFVLAGSGGDPLTPLFSQYSINGTYGASVTMLVYDPTNGDYGAATNSGSWTIPSSGSWAPPLTSIGSSGTTFAFASGAWSRASAGPVLGWAECTVGRLA